MRIFEAVKNAVNMISTAEHYGISINRRGLTNCIFHNDRHPSMKLYKDHYHCFACGAHGDVIAFTAQLFGLSPYEAAKKIASEFGIEYDNTGRDSTSKVLPLPKNKRNTADEMITLLSEYIAVLEEDKIKYASAAPDEELHPLYTESIQRLPQYQYYLDILIHGSDEERNEFLQNERRLFNELRTKLRQPRMAIR